jgi:hypothetical protein
MLLFDLMAIFKRLRCSLVFGCCWEKSVYFGLFWFLEKFIVCPVCLICPAVLS